MQGFFSNDEVYISNRKTTKYIESDFYGMQCHIDVIFNDGVI